MGRDYPLSTTPSFDSIPKPMSRRDKEKANVYQESIKKEYNKSSNPKLEWKNKNKTEMIQARSLDTSGLASGKKVFPQKVTLAGGKEGYVKVGRNQVKRQIAKSKKS